MSPVRRACLGPQWGVRCPTNQYIASGSRCQECQRAVYRLRNATRDPLPPSIYRTTAWRRLAEAVVANAVVCAWCGTSAALTKLTAGHIVSITHAPSRALDPSNVAASCRSCQERAKHEPDVSKWPAWARRPQ